MKSNRRTQAQRSADTRAALLAAGRDLFAANGFAAVSTPAIAARAGLTRGALYHQFDDKTELFAAVLEEVEAEVLARVQEAVMSSSASDPVALMVAAADAWCDIASEPEVHRIVLLEAPAALGWTRWREIGQKYAVGMTEALLDGAITQGAMTPQPVRALAHVLVGALDEAAMYIAAADDRDTARTEMKAVLTRMVTALASDQ